MNRQPNPTTNGDARRPAAAGAKRGRPLVPDHRLIRRIGQGSYGEVWLARNVMGTYRAAKIVFRRRFEDARPFEREFDGLQRFEPISRTHAGFVSILHVGRNAPGGYFYSIMELADDVCSTGSLAPASYVPRTLSRELCMRGRLPLDECLQLALALTGALEHVHRHGLVHRDLKPANVVYVGGTPRLADIGLVTVIGGDTGSAVGTPGYFPPEGPGSPGADLFGLGMILYQAMTGKGLQEYPDLPSRLREMGDTERFLALNQVVLRATDRDPGQRYACAADLSGALRSLVRQTPAGSPAPCEVAFGGGTAKGHSGRVQGTGERKLVTALSVAVGWAGPVDPEDAQAILQRLGRLVESQIERCGGVTEPMVGTSMVSVFGAPAAHEDHAARAVHAGLAIQRVVAADRGGLAGGGGLAFEVRCALDTGLAVVGGPGDRPGLPAITGEPIHRASRLSHLASPGQLLITEGVWRSVGEQFVTHAIDEPFLPGWYPGVRVFEVTGTASVRSNLEGGTGKRLSPFVGREGERAHLHARFAEVVLGRGQVVLVAGEPGLGKSRLLLEFRNSFAEPDVAWLTGRSVAFGREMALRPVIEMVRDFVGIEATDELRSVAEKVNDLRGSFSRELHWTLPWLRYLLGAAAEDDSVAAMDARLRRTRTFEAIRALFWDAALRRPLILAVEDIHWADPASGEFLSYLADSIGAARVLLLATYRSGYQPAFPERGYVDRVTLNRLSEKESMQIAQSMIGSTAFPAGLRRLINSRAEGNPFFVEELTRSLLEDGAVRLNSGGGVLVPSLSGLEVPDTVQNVLMSRIDRLPEGAKTVLQLASVIGREFALVLLEAISDLRDPVHGPLWQLKQAELIYECGALPGTAYVFKHALTQEVAYNSLLIQRRKELHRLVAASIEELYADRISDFFGTLAYHYQLGEEWQRALDYLVRAADGAQRIGGYHEQAGLLTRAIEIAGRIHRHEIIPRLRAQRGVAYSRTGVWGEARRELELSLRDMPADLAEERAELLLELAGVCFWALAIPEMNRYAQQGLVLAEQAGREDLAAGFMGWWAAGDQSNGDLASATRRFERALARGGGIRWASLANYPLTLYLSGRIKNAIERGRQSAEMCASLSDHRAAIFGNPHLALALAASGRYGEAMRLFDQVLELGAKHEVWPFHARAMAMSAGLHLDVYDFPGHEALAQEARERGRMVNWHPPVVSAGIDLVFNYARRHEVAAAEKLLAETAEAVVETGGWHRWLWELRLALARAEVALVRGETTEALRWAEECIRQSRARGRLKYQVGGLAARARALVGCGRQEKAVRDLRSALKLARSVGDPAMLLRVGALLLRCEGTEALHEETRATARQIVGALPTEPMRQRFLAGTPVQPG